MGQFKLEIVAVGGHGCQREKKDGELLYGCGRQDCPDCAFFSLVADFARRTGANVESATETHWPGSSSEVVDKMDLSDVAQYQPLRSLGIPPRRRHGSFA